MTETDPANRSKIVIGVDDVPQNITLLKYAIAAMGYSFVGATSGTECLALAHRIQPRLILLDIEMPEMDGFETCRRLRGNPTLAQVPIAFLTVRKTPRDVREGLDAGGNDFIIKPFEQAQLRDRVNHWVNRRVPPASVI